MISPVYYQLTGKSSQIFIITYMKMKHCYINIFIAFVVSMMIERRSRRSRTEAQRRKLVRERENIGAAMMLLGFLLLMVIGGAEDLTVIFLGGLAGLSLMLLGGWLGHAFYGQEKDAEWLRRERDEDVF